MAVKQNLNSFSFVTASPFLCLRFSPDHQVADVSGRNPNRIRADADTLTCTSVLFLVLGADNCTRCLLLVLGADNCTSIFTGVLLLVMVQMLVLVLNRIQLSEG